MKTSTERMIAKKDGPIGWMQFNNPARHNAVSVDMWKAVPEIMTEFANDEQIRVVVLSGAGGINVATVLNSNTLTFTGANTFNGPFSAAAFSASNGAAWAP